jgi:NADPH:quinone reductase-like Zn-dependent oxidoreductase
MSAIRTNASSALFRSSTGEPGLNAQIGRSYPLAEAAQAHIDIESRRTTGKLLLLP